MSKVLVIGAGLNGLAAAMLLARDGHDVTVVERDVAEPTGDPDSLWQDWRRRGVNQFHHPHFMLPRWRTGMEHELPYVLTELEQLGARHVNTVGILPESMTGGHRETDDQFDTITARRPVLEAAVTAAACRLAIDVRRGVTVTGLLTGPRERTDRDVPHVTGVMTGGGETLHADLVVDASGRRSAVSTMLAQTGAPHPREEREDTGFVYYTRHYRGDHPTAQGLLLQHFPTVSTLTLPCDSDTWAVGFVTSARDRELRALRHLPTWERALSLYPTVAHWGMGEPITGIQVIAGIEDRYRRMFSNGQPVATGLVVLGDAWACSNPSLGRGASIGLVHACVLRDALRDVRADDPLDLVHRFDQLTEQTVTPLYRATLAFDRHRIAEIDAEIAGVPYVTPDASWALSTSLYAAAHRDPDLLRVQGAIAALIATPQQALAGPGLLERVVAIGANAPRYPEDAPSRSELLDAAADVTSLAGGMPPAYGSATSPALATRSVARRQVHLHVQDVGAGDAVLLLHGWPDDHRVWHNQTSALVASGRRVIAPDLRGFGRSDKPVGVDQYGLMRVVSDVLQVLDERGVARAHLVGHDWGGAIAAVVAAIAPARVASLTCLSVGHPAAFAAAGLAQREKSWYMLLFQFPGIAEQWLAQDDFANLRAWTQHPEIENVVARFREPGALTSSLGLYRAIVPPETMLAPAVPLPPIQAPSMGIWSAADLGLTEQAVTGTAAYVAAPWRYERLEGVGHWMQLEAPDVVTGLVIDFIDGVQPAEAAPTRRFRQPARRGLSSSLTRSAR